MYPITVISGFRRNVNEVCALSGTPVGLILKCQAPHRTNWLPMNGFS